MKIQTLGTGLLHDVHRQRNYLQGKIDRRNRFWFVCGFTILATAITYALIIYK